MRSAYIRDVPTIRVQQATHAATLFKCNTKGRVLQVHHTDAEWKSMLSPGAYRVLRQSGTEFPRSSPLDQACHHSRPVLAGFC